MKLLLISGKLMELENIMSEVTLTQSDKCLVWILTPFLLSMSVDPGDWKESLGEDLTIINKSLQ